MDRVGSVHTSEIEEGSSLTVEGSQSERHKYDTCTKEGSGDDAGVGGGGWVERERVYCMYRHNVTCVATYLGSISMTACSSGPRLNPENDNH